MQWLKSKKCQNRQCSLYHNQRFHGLLQYWSESPWLFSLSKSLQNMESCPLKPVRLWPGMVQQITTQRHLAPYWQNRVVSYLQNKIVACTGSLRQYCIAFCSNNYSQPVLSGIIGLIAAQNCQEALQNMKSFKLVRLWSGMVQQITTRRHLSPYWQNRVVSYFLNEIVACTGSLRQYCIAFCSNF